MSAIHNILPSPLSPPNPITKNLLSLRKTGANETDRDADPKWCEKAIKSLVKKLRRANMIEELEKAIRNEDSTTMCITIPRSLDGRLQVQQRKGMPHVIYSRMWRYPDLQSHNQLKAVPHCEYAWAKKRDEVCVNPYHYEKQDAPVLPPIMVPRYQTGTGNTLGSGGSGTAAPGSTMPPADVVSATSARMSSVSLTSSGGGGGSNATVEIRPLDTSPQNSFLPPQSPLSTVSTPASVQHHEQLSPGPGRPPDNVHFAIKQEHLDLNGGVGGMPRATGGMGLSSIGLSGNVTVASSKSVTEPLHLFPVNVDSPSGGYLSEDNDPMDQSSPISDTTTNISSMPQSPQDNIVDDLYNSVEYKEPEHWAKIHVYEYNTRVGEAYECTQPSVVVDGYVSTSSDRFCLGSIPHVNRCESVIECRKHIGRGARFTYMRGEVYVECMSNSAIFVQSPNCNRRYGWHPCTVCKIPPGCSLPVFNNAEFATLLRNSVNEGWDAVWALNRMCTIRVSFVKGWGADYRRQTIMATPVWIELHLNGPYQWLDRVLRCMHGPKSVIGSQS